jgi:hypothetical protein
MKMGLNIEAVRSTETLVTTEKTTRRHKIIIDSNMAVGLDLVCINCPLNNVSYDSFDLVCIKLPVK